MFCLFYMHSFEGYITSVSTGADAQEVKVSLISS